MSTHNNFISPNRQKHKKASLAGLAFLFILGCKTTLPTWYSPSIKNGNDHKEERIFAVEELKEPIYSIVNESASYPGGLSAWRNHLKSQGPLNSKKSKLRKPSSSVVSFVVKMNGEICNIRSSRSLDESQSNKIVNLLLASGRWIPAKIKDKSVNSP